MVVVACYSVFLFTKLRKLLNEECSMPTGMRVKLESMEMLLEPLREKYNIIGDVSWSEVQVAECTWLCQTKKLFYDAEVLVDFLLVAAECPEPSTDLVGISMLFEKIKKIKERCLLLNELIFKEGPNLRALYKQEEETELVGIDGPRDTLIKMLAERDDMSEKRRKLVFITGFGGSGKTTLARVVYNQLKPQFDCGAFVRAPGYVFASDESEARTRAFLQEMLSQLDPENPMIVNKSAFSYWELTAQVKQFLQNKRYLVVIDDAHGSQQIDYFLQVLANDVCGSRIISTIHIDNIIRLSLSHSSEPVYVMKSLGYLDSRKLFLKQFFVSEASYPNAPTEVLNEILKMCGGRPSAIISIALVLATRVTATRPWEEILNSVYSAWKQMGSFLDFEADHSLDLEELVQVLLLLYGQLSSTLKKCLMYLNIHARNQMIHRVTMVRKWIAAEYISASNENYEHSYEELASRYFDELIDRNFIQLIEYGNYLGKGIYEVNHKMHNVLRWLSQDNNFATVLSDGCTSREYERCICLTIQCYGTELSVYTSKMNSDIFSVTIVGRVKFYANCYMWSLRLLDLDGCRDLDNSSMDHICQMTFLTYLSLKHTQVTEISPKIGELQLLKTLDISETEISNLPPEVWKLQKLMTLDASHTQISFVPREIRELQNLETLDVRQTQVKELPKEIVQLPKLADLYFGRLHSPQGVKLPVGSQQLTSLKVFGTVDSRQWSGSAMDEISGLTGVRELEVVLHDQPADKHQNDKLLSSIGKCENLKSLIIHGDYNPSDNLPISTKFPLLERLKIAGRFVKVPRWLAQLTTLKQIYVRVCKLDRDDFKILGGLPGLSNLAVALVCIPWKKEVAITGRLHTSTCTTDLPPLEETCPAGFTSLEIFSFDCRVPWITFEQGAMPRLRKLHLKLYAFPAGKVPSGITNLHGLEKIILEYSSEYASSGGIKKVVSALSEEASSHDNMIKIFVNGYPEAFLPNTRADETITSTEFEEASNRGNRIELSVDGEHDVLETREEDSNHGNQIELSVNGDHEVLLPNTRVDETKADTEIKECY